VVGMRMRVWAFERSTVRRSARRDWRWLREIVPRQPPLIPPRIAIIAEKYGGIGGSERFVKEVTERLAATGK